jgi:hypothetical protein
MEDKMSLSPEHGSDELLSSKDSSELDMIPEKKSQMPYASNVHERHYTNTKLKKQNKKKYIYI